MTNHLLAERRMQTKHRIIFLKQCHIHLMHFLFIYYGRSNIQRFWNLSLLILFFRMT